MIDLQNGLTWTFQRFFRSETSSSLLLLLCTALALAIANSPLGPGYLDFWHGRLAGLSLEHWVNDALMAVFFLFVGLELERELYSGELSDYKKALLPLIAALGGMAVPAAIHFAVNVGTPTQAGIGIPMATDIAFALGVLALLGRRIPASLKIFLTALAVMDDLGAIVMIAGFYTLNFALEYLIGALLVFGVLVRLNVKFRVMALFPYLIGGSLMWYLMYQSGVHATVAGVLLAFAIPFSARSEDETSPSHRLEHALNLPVAFVILPLFALANTGILIAPGWQEDLFSTNGLGIIGGLLVGKPLGIILFCLLAVAMGVCRLPADLRWFHIFGAGILGGIGFTMSIFISNLAFASEPHLINASKMAILLASCSAGVLGFLWLTLLSRRPSLRTPAG